MLFFLFQHIFCRYQSGEQADGGGGFCCGASPHGCLLLQSLRGSDTGMASPIASAGVMLKSGETVRADFVVDASGRGSQLPQWLQSVGIVPPPAQTISAGLGYGSRTYAMPDNWFQHKVPHRCLSTSCTVLCQHAVFCLPLDSADCSALQGSGTRAQLDVCTLAAPTLWHLLQGVVMLDGTGV